MNDEQGIDPTIYEHAETMAELAYPEQPCSRADVERLAEAFQKAFEEWSEDIENPIVPQPKGGADVP